MAKKIYKFPEGTTSVKPIEINKALCLNDVVEFPGSIVNITVKPSAYAQRVKAQELIFHEGIREIVLGPGCPFKYNIPKSAIKIDSIMYDSQEKPIGPRVLCLDEKVQQAYGLYGVEYLQGWNTSEIRYLNAEKLKHYVFLGKGRLKSYAFNNLPEGCVIHVENVTMAKKVMKVCSIHADVVPDALEWKDFPKEKLALTAEEYNSSSRILPEQIKLREEWAHEKEEQKRQEEDSIRQYKKQQLMAGMADTILQPLLKPAGFDYSVQMNEDLATCTIEISVIQNLWDRYGTLWMEARIPLDQVAQYAQELCDMTTRIGEFHMRQHGVMELHNITYALPLHRSTRISSDIPPCGLSLPMSGGQLTASLRQEHLLDDVQTIKQFADELNALLQTSIPEGVQLKRGY
ncbi:MAG: hypothetical protein Q4B58_07235 [Bacteroidales bacterium]|nr:hypothetical protein [Bacteroidales bacterium]